MTNQILKYTDLFYLKIDFREKPMSAIKTTNTYKAIFTNYNLNELLALNRQHMTNCQNKVACKIDFIRSCL